MLEESVRSVWAQTRLPCEILIGDDSPDTDTERLVATVLRPASPVEIRYFRNRPSLGEALNVDFLYRESRGDAILHMHDDDPVYPSCIDLLAKPLEEAEEIAASFGMQSLMDESGQPLASATDFNTHFFRTLERAGRVDGVFAGATRMFPNNGFLVRSDLAKTIGYDDKGRAGYARDFYFGFRLGQLGRPFYFVPELTAQSRMTTSSESRGNPDADNAYRTMSILLSELSPELLARCEIKKTLRGLAPLAITIAVRRGEKAKAIGWLLSAHYRHAITSPRWWWRLLQCFLPVGRR